MPTMECKDCSIAILQSMGGGLDDDGLPYSLCGSCASRRIDKMRAAGLTFVPPPKVSGDDNWPDDDDMEELLEERTD